MPGWSQCLESYHCFAAVDWTTVKASGLLKALSNYAQWLYIGDLASNLIKAIHAHIAKGRYSDGPNANHNSCCSRLLL